jgi:hypothetical protein
MLIGTPRWFLRRLMHATGAAETARFPAGGGNLIDDCWQEIAGTGRLLQGTCRRKPMRAGAYLSRNAFMIWSCSGLTR